MPKKRRIAPSLEEMLHALQAIFDGRLAPSLGGYAYRFTIFLPLLSNGKEVFSQRQRYMLTGVFHACMKGYSETTSDSQPPCHGSWVPTGTDVPVVDRHTVIVVYTPQIEEAKDFFAQLRWILEQKQVANQDVILIEHTTVWLVESSPLAGME